jgi:S-adenosylmethionine/arginine decarboxylase-like enzyme
MGEEIRKNVEGGNGGVVVAAGLGAGSAVRFRGRQVVCDLVGVVSPLLRDACRLLEVVKRAAKEAGATVVDSWCKDLPVPGMETPVGVTLGVVLDESHIAVHGYFEEGLAGVEAFTCGVKADPVVAVGVIRDALGGSVALWREEERFPDRVVFPERAVQRPGRREVEMGDSAPGVVGSGSAGASARLERIGGRLAGALEAVERLWERDAARADEVAKRMGDLGSAISRGRDVVLKHGANGVSTFDNLQRLHGDVEISLGLRPAPVEGSGGGAA